MALPTPLLSGRLCLRFLRCQDKSSCKLQVIRAEAQPLLSRGKYDSLPAFFTARRMLIANTGASPVFYPVSEYVQMVRQNLDKQNITL